MCADEITGVVQQFDDFELAVSLPPRTTKKKAPEVLQHFEGSSER